MFDLLKKKLLGFTNKVKEQEERELKADLSNVQKVRAIISKEIQLKEKDIETLLFELELNLLESDVTQETATDLTEKIKESLLSRKFNPRDLDRQIQAAVKETLSSLIEVPAFSLVPAISEKEKPVKILFLGPNGAGKTTTIAKTAFLLQKNNLKSIFSASDTFRAASIEQIQEHADRLGIKVIQKGYKADPASVAFDAVNSAKANSLDVVLIDSAGRQETNKNLMKELEKIVRVIKPDFKIFIGESIAGKTLINQAKEFDKELGIDAFILTKVDVDEKGGSVISLLHEVKKPIIFIGFGQKYEDLKEFSAIEMIELIIP